MMLFQQNFCITCFLKQGYFVGICLLALVVAPLLVYFVNSERTISKYPFASAIPYLSRLIFLYIFFGMAIRNW